MTKIKLNEDTDLQLFHTLFTGQTNLSGKTTAIRTLAPRAVKEGFTVLVFDTKPTIREFDGYHDIPLCYRPTTDPLVLIGLLEGIFKRRLSMLYSTLGRIAEKAKDIPDIIENAKALEEKSKSGFVKDACWQLADLLDRLQKELKGLDLSTSLELREGEINVMPLNDLSMEAQQLIIKTAFELALKHHNKKTILVIDEAFRFLPQAYGSACKRPVEDAVTQGAKTEFYVWLATQFIATTEKAAIKAMANKLLGRQDDITEIDATIDRTRESHPKLKPDDLMTLRRGEFIFVPIDGPVKKVYIPMSEDLRHEKTTHEWKTILRPWEAAPVQEQLETPKEPEPPRTVIEAAAQAVRTGISPRLSPPPKPETKPFAEFTITVTKLESPSLEGKIVFTMKKLNKSVFPRDILNFFQEYGWVVPATTLSSALKRMAEGGLLFYHKRQGYYRFLENVGFDIKEKEA